MKPKILITLDYELFFGKNTGTVENSLIIPTTILTDICAKYSVPLTFFVDAGYLIALERCFDNHSILQRDFNLISKDYF